MAPPLENFTSVMIEKERLHMSLIENDTFSRTPISLKLPPNTTFILDGRVHKNLKLNVQSFIRLDCDELQYKMKVEPIMPLWFKN